MADWADVVGDDGAWLAWGAAASRFGVDYHAKAVADAYARLAAQLASLSAAGGHADEKDGGYPGPLVSRITKKKNYTSRLWAARLGVNSKGLEAALRAIDNVPIKAHLRVPISNSCAPSKERKPLRSLLHQIRVRLWNHLH